MKEFFLRN